MKKASLLSKRNSISPETGSSYKSSDKNFPKSRNVETSNGLANVELNGDPPLTFDDSFEEVNYMRVPANIDADEEILSEAKTSNPPCYKSKDNFEHVHDSSNENFYTADMIVHIESKLDAPLNDVEKSPKEVRVSKGTVSTGAKSKENSKICLTPNYSEVIKTSSINSLDRSDFNRVIHRQHLTNEIIDFNDRISTESNIDITTTPVTASSLSLASRERKENPVTSSVITPADQLKMQTKRSNSICQNHSEDEFNYIHEEVISESAKKITSIAYKELSTKSARVRHSSRFSIFRCLCHLFHKRNKRHNISNKKIHAVINKTYFINWVRQEVDGDPACERCCEKKSTIKRSQSICF
ncbi:uncharacterized protein LOC119689178 isoform X2 [Teleopsis dalmanni]|uniref:uncharacterized protein LOC119689178 isoform X2 n=1 Tax=Teleopsis dalmanni TaxID=139649 RepID=UPI0018CEBAA5|nr:uncharacterized protein LOC119689178 isoform X2 [Teleopsis dalmanni]